MSINSLTIKKNLGSLLNNSSIINGSHILQTSVVNEPIIRETLTPLQQESIRQQQVQSGAYQTTSVADTGITPYEKTALIAGVLAIVGATIYYAKKNKNKPLKVTL